MLTVTKADKWMLYWGSMPLPEGATALGVVNRAPGDTGALIRLASGVYVQGNAGGIRTLPQHETGDALAVSDAAVALGRKGGSKTSAAKKTASAANGRKGGRPKKENVKAEGQTRG